MVRSVALEVVEPRDLLVLGDQGRGPVGVLETEPDDLAMAATRFTSQELKRAGPGLEVCDHARVARHEAARRSPLPGVLLEQRWRRAWNDGYVAARDLLAQCSPSDGQRPE